MQCILEIISSFNFREEYNSLTFSVNDCTLRPLTFTETSEILQGAFPKKVEKDVEGKEEELFENHVKHNEEKEMGLNKKVLEEKNDEEDYYLSVEIRTNSTKIVI
ncbi:hypothetical protein pdam_00022103 [Pocillopora damicornis]|uniref:Uncharacterized protein n=1 Tax=Pocillopora damicornis TaxID=46731 RepID=A0A3M6TBQ6_POCDA|nr:hypothetical protein pdam_00022103 [Pocillopora damicornis]